MTKRSLTLLFCTLTLLHISARAQSSIENKPNDTVRAVIRQFEAGLKDRSVEKIESVVARDLVVLENGHRNDGWIDFRDNHLIPEMKEPSTVSNSEVIKVESSEYLAWAYTRTEMRSNDASGKSVDVLVWSVYVLKKQSGEWKIALLDWSLRRLKPQEKAR